MRNAWILGIGLVLSCLTGATVRADRPESVAVSEPGRLIGIPECVLPPIPVPPDSPVLALRKTEVEIRSRPLRRGDCRPALPQPCLLSRHRRLHLPFPATRRADVELVPRRHRADSRGRRGLLTMTK